MLEEIGSEGIILNSHMSQVNFNIMSPDSLSHHCLAIKSEWFFFPTYLSVTIYYLTTLTEAKQKKVKPLKL